MFYDSGIEAEKKCRPRKGVAESLGTAYNESIKTTDYIIDEIAKNVNSNFGSIFPELKNFSSGTVANGCPHGVDRTDSVWGGKLVLPRKRTYEVIDTLAKEYKSVAKKLAENPELRKQCQEKSFSRLQSALAPFVMALDRGFFSDNLLKSVARAVVRCNRAVQVTAFNGERTTFLGMQKGLSRYNLKIRAGILDRTEIITSHDRQVLFLTTTYDAKGYTAPRLRAWQTYQKRISDMMALVRKRWDGLYEGIAESTANGYPHAHIILSFPQGTFPEYVGLEGKKKINFGTFYNWVKLHSPAPVFALESVGQGKLKWYLTKYVSKAGEMDIYTISEKSAALKKNERKELLGLFCSQVSGKNLSFHSQVRTIRKCIPQLSEEEHKTLDRLSREKQPETMEGGIKSDKAKVVHFAETILMEKKRSKRIRSKSEFSRREKLMKAKISEVIARIQGMREDNEENRGIAQRFRRFLIKICNISEFSCQKVFGFLPLKGLEKSQIEDLLQKKATFKLEDTKTGANVKYAGCSGCIYSVFAQIVLGIDSDYTHVLQDCGDGFLEDTFFSKRAQNPIVWAQRFIEYFGWYARAKITGILLDKERLPTKDFVFGQFASRPVWNRIIKTDRDWDGLQYRE